jgi:predicted alpha/beta-fold hydrolase
MPIIESTYKAPWGFFNGHLQTIYAFAFRKVNAPNYSRERIATPDGDFLDLDWINTKSNKCVIISHGLEASSNATYVKAMSNYFSKNTFTTCAWNFRGCSGEMNKKFPFYHIGDTNDLETVINHVAKRFSEIYLIGFSIGGNKTLKYLGEFSESVHPAIKGSVVFSVPMHLKGSSATLEKRSTFLYRNRFLRKLKEKHEAKEPFFPGKISLKNYSKIKTLRQYDDLYSSSIYGFKNADDYYEKCSSIFFIPSIKTQTLIVSAKNDPFFSESCFPIKECENHPYVTLEMPVSGGHVGFMSKGNVYWSEKRALEFFSSLNRNRV